MPRTPASTKQAVLPVDQGRKRRQISKLNLDLVGMTYEALAQAGGVAYLVQQAHKCPAAFIKLLGQTLPLVVKHDAANIEVFVRAIHMVAQPVPGVLASPVKGHVMSLVHDAAVARREDDDDEEATDAASAG